MAFRDAFQEHLLFLVRDVVAGLPGKAARSYSDVPEIPSRVSLCTVK